MAVSPTLPKKADYPQRFRTYFSYFKAWQILFDHRYGPLPKCPLKAAIGCPEYQKLYRKSSISPQVSSFLRNAWSTEVLIRLPLHLENGSTENMIVIYSCAWAPVQAYYAVHSALTAVASAENRSLKHHKPALNYIAEKIATQTWFPEVHGSWCRGLSELHNVSFSPSMRSCSVPRVSNLQTRLDPDEALAMVMKCLKTTRKRDTSAVLEAAKKDYVEKNPGATRVPVAILQSAEAPVLPTTLFDFLYRVRRRCNYEETDAFIRGATVEGCSWDFILAISAVVGHTLAFLETLVCGRVGETAFRQIVGDYVSDTAKGCIEVPVADRWGINYP